VRTVTEVVFSDEERRVMALCGRWIGAIDPDPESDIARGGRAVFNADLSRNHAYNHDALTRMLKWIDASLVEFDHRRQEAAALIEAPVPERDGKTIPLVENPAVMGHVLLEAAIDATADLNRLRPIIEQALLLASPRVPDRKYEGV